MACKAGTIFHAESVHPPWNTRDNASERISHEGRVMNWKAANEQHDEARWRVFLMFVAMALLMIRTGSVSRGLLDILSTQSAAQDVSPPVNHQPSSTPPDADLRRAILVLLCLAEAAGRLFILRERAVWDLMNRPLARPEDYQPLDIASLCERSAQRLDTS